jgi:hypothetical protein
MITPQTIVKTELAIIKQVFDEEGKLDTTFVVVQDGAHISIPLILMPSTDRDRVSKTLRDLTAQVMPDFVIYISEAWCAIVSDNKCDLPPSKHPDRVEIVIVTIEFKTGERFLCTANIKRENNTARLEEFEIKTDLSLGTTGRFMNFYPKVSAQTESG